MAIFRAGDRHQVHLTCPAGPRRGEGVENGIRVDGLKSMVRAGDS